MMMSQRLQKIPSSRAQARDLTSGAMITQSSLSDGQQIGEILHFVQDDTRSY
jgi:hypothetical protein